MWSVYILQCDDGSFYVGITLDIQERLKRHDAGQGAKYTKIRRPIVLKYIEEFTIKSSAEKREKEIKSFSRRNKERLVVCGLGKTASLVTDNE